MIKLKQKNDEIIRRMVLNAAFGIVLMEISGAVTYIIDGIITSRFIGSTALSASSMAGFCFTLFAVISGVISAGAQQICSNDVGKGKVKEANKTFSAVVFVTLVLSVLIALFGIIFPGLVANLVGASTNDAELYGYARDYIQGFFIGAPGHIFIAVLIPEVQLEGKNKLITASIAVLTVADILGDLLNVLVFHGGMFGMGLATSISYFLSAVVLMFAFLRKESMLKISFKNMSFSAMPSLLNIGLPRATKRIGNLVRPLVINRLILIAGGSIAMAAFSVEQNLRYFTESVGVGIAGAAFLLVGMFIGEKDSTSLKKTNAVTIRYIIFGVGALAVVYFIAAPWIAMLYHSTTSPSYGWAVAVLRCHAVSLPFLAFNEFYISLVQATGKIKLAHFVTFLNKFAYIVALSFALQPFGVWGLWFAIPLSEILLCATIVVVNAVKNAKSPKRKSPFSLCDDVSENPDSSVELTIDGKDDVFEMNRIVEEFCQKQNMDSKQSYYVQLFFEEMAMLIIDHGFDGKKKYSVAIRIYKDDDSLILRTKDNCRAFTAQEQKTMYDKSTSGEYLGISMVFGLAKDVKYINTMNINNFIVTI